MLPYNETAFIAVGMRQPGLKPLKVDQKRTSPGIKRSYTSFRTFVNRGACTLPGSIEMTTHTV